MTRILRKIKINLSKPSQLISIKQTIENMNIEIYDTWQENNLLWFEGTEDANYVNMLDDKAWKVANTDGCIFPSGIMNSFLLLLKHHRHDYLQNKNILLNKTIWNSGNREIYTQGNVMYKECYSIVGQADGKTDGHYGVLHVTKNAGTIYDGLSASLEDEYKECYILCQKALGLSQPLFSDVTITTPCLSQSTDEQTPHVLIRDQSFVQQSGTKACGSIACAVLYYVLDNKKHHISNAIQHTSRPIVLYLVTNYMNQYKECLFDGERKHSLCTTDDAYAVFLQFISFGKEFQNKVTI